MNRTDREVHKATPSGRSVRIPSITAAEAHDRMQEGVPLIDVREDDEWARARIPDAVHVPISRFMDHLPDIPKDRPVVVFCAAGSRSAQVTAWLNGNGYDATNMAGGILSWAAEGLPLGP